MRKFGLLILFFSLSFASCQRQETMQELTERVFERAAAQLALLDYNLDSAALAVPEQAIYPRSTNQDGSLWTTHYKWWGSGFYPGSLWYVYEYTGDVKFKNMALKYQVGLEQLKFRTDHHDIGFQLMCSYGNHFRLTGDTISRSVLIDGARSLATRFDPEVGCTRSWDFGKWTFPVIIDNMMNLELLLKAAELSDDRNLKNVALAHARTTMKNHFREDNSCFHLVDYDPQTGAVLKKQTHQGYADDSAWARGQAWALYGYSMVYRFTKKLDMLDHAVKVAEYIIPRLPEDGVPYWDFDSPDIPDDVRDASAAAIIAGGLIELSGYVDAEKSGRYLSVAEKILRTLASDDYLAAEGEQYGFLLKHSTGFKKKNQELDAPLVYADYYFLEALHRWKKRSASISGAEPLTSLRPDVTVLLYADSLKGTPDPVYGKQIVSAAFEMKQANGLTGPEELVDLGRMHNISDLARMDVYLPEKGNGKMVVICPGGGNIRISTYDEGLYVAEWFLSRGVAAAVAKYRMPNMNRTVPLDDIQNMFRYCRSHAEEWNISKVGVMGFSAGGHLAACASNLWVDEATRPDFTILFYPVTTFDRKIFHGRTCWNLIGREENAEDKQQYQELMEYYSMENRITPSTPPAFITHCINDGIRVDNSMVYYSRLAENKVPAEMHLWPDGGHGWGFPSPLSTDDDRFSAHRQKLYELLENWLKNLNL